METATYFNGFPLNVVTGVNRNLRVRRDNLRTVVSTIDNTSEKTKTITRPL